MNYSYEIVATPKRIPAKIVIHTDPGVVLKHWHKDLELTYLYKGNATFSTNGIITSIEEKQLYLVNSGDVHSVMDYGEKLVTMITVLISYNFIKDNCSDIDNLEFKLRGNNKSIQRLKDIHEEIVDMYLKDMENNNTSLVFVDDENSNDKFHYLKIQSLIYEILYILLNDFSIKRNANLELKNERNLERLKIITDYIDANYKDNISLDEIADKYQLSKEYLATIFKKYMGMTVGSYLKNIRLTSAYRDLMNSDYSINQLAFDNGFPNIKSFINSFKQHYGETPYKYKKKVENASQ